MPRNKKRQQKKNKFLRAHAAAAALTNSENRERTFQNEPEPDQPPEPESLHPSNSEVWSQYETVVKCRTVLEFALLSLIVPQKDPTMPDKPKTPENNPASPTQKGGWERLMNPVQDLGRSLLNFLVGGPTTGNVQQSSDASTSGAGRQRPVGHPANPSTHSTPIILRRRASGSHNVPPQNIPSQKVEPEDEGGLASPPAPFTSRRRKSKKPDETHAQTAPINLPVLKKVELSPSCSYSSSVETFSMPVNKTGPSSSLAKKTVVTLPQAVNKQLASYSVNSESEKKTAEFEQRRQKDAMGNQQATQKHHAPTPEPRRRRSQDVSPQVSMSSRDADMPDRLSKLIASSSEEAFFTATSTTPRNSMLVTAMKPRDDATKLRDAFFGKNSSYQTEQESTASNFKRCDLATSAVNQTLPDKPENSVFAKVLRQGATKDLVAPEKIQDEVPKNVTNLPEKDLLDFSAEKEKVTSERKLSSDVTPQVNIARSSSSVQVEEEDSKKLQVTLLECVKNNRAGISETSCENESDQLNFSSVMKNYDDNEKNKTEKVDFTENVDVNVNTAEIAEVKISLLHDDACSEDEFSKTQKESVKSEVAEENPQNVDVVQTVDEEVLSPELEIVDTKKSDPEQNSLKGNFDSDPESSFVAEQVDPVILVEDSLTVNEPVLELEAKQEHVLEVKVENEPALEVETEQEPVLKVEVENELVSKVQVEKDPVLIEAEQKLALEVEAEQEPTLEVEAEQEPAVEVEAENETVLEVEAEQEPILELNSKQETTLEIEAELEPAFKVEAELEPAFKVEAEQESALKLEVENEPALKVNAEQEITLEVVSADESIGNELNELDLPEEESVLQVEQGEDEADLQVNAEEEIEPEAKESSLTVESSMDASEVEIVESGEVEDKSNQMESEENDKTNLGSDFPVEPAKEENLVDDVDAEEPFDDEHERTPVNEEETRNINDQICEPERNENVLDESDQINISKIENEDKSNDESFELDGKEEVSELLQNDISGEILKSPEAESVSANSQIENIQNSSEVPEITQQFEEEKVSDTFSLGVEFSATEKHSEEDVVVQEQKTTQNVEEIFEDDRLSENEAQSDDKSVTLEKEESLLNENSSNVESSDSVVESETPKESDLDRESKPSQPAGSIVPAPPPPPPPDYLPRLQLQLAAKKVEKKVGEGPKKISTAEQVKNVFKMVDYVF